MARASGADPALVVRETAARWPGSGSIRRGWSPPARASSSATRPPGPLWWLCAADADHGRSPGRGVRVASRPSRRTPTADELAMALPEEATICVVGWPDLVAQALVRRGDVTVLAVDGQAEGHGLARRLRRVDVEAEEVGTGGLGASGGHCGPRAARGRGHRPGRLRGSGGHPRRGRRRLLRRGARLAGQRRRPAAARAAVALRRHPSGRGRGAVGGRPRASPRSRSMSALCGPAGPEPVADGLRRLDCPVAPKLLRSSPF